jgi:deoxyribonuclease-4
VSTPPTPPVGAHVWGRDPLAEAAEVGADCIQLFLSDPQGWEKPPERDDAAELRDSEVGIYVHAPYLINVCSPKPNVRYGSRKILTQTCEAAAAVGALAVIVHPGHSEDGLEAGVGRWVRTLEMLESEVPVLLENTAGGEHAVARRFDALAELWTGCAGAATDVEVGFCLDTCHAHAAGEGLGDAVERARAITGRIDLLHVNDSRDPPGTGADRHANIGAGTIDPEVLRAMIRSADAPSVVETPREVEALRADVQFVRAALAG